MVPGILDAKGTKILAKSLFKELRGNGYSTQQILSLSTELIALVTQDLRTSSAPARDAAEAAVPMPPVEATAVEPRLTL